MNVTWMTIRNKDWHRDEILAEWRGDHDEQIAQDAADTEIAYLINHTTDTLGPGWSYRSQDGAFSGPYRGAGHHPVADILLLTQKACDHTLNTLNLE